MLRVPPIRRHGEVSIASSRPVWKPVPLASGGRDTGLTAVRQYRRPSTAHLFEDRSMTVDERGKVAIRTPDQRLRVFVSSTLAELAEERAAVARAISALRLTPVLFELGARPHPPRELYRAYLAQSDIFIGLYWQRYGWVGPGMEISGLEDELRLSQSIPRLLYVKTPAPDREPGLTGLIEGLQRDGTDAYRTFRTTRELGRL